MKLFKKTILTTSLVAVLSGCSTTPEEKAEAKLEHEVKQQIENRDAQIDSAPEWFFENKASEVGFFASGTFYSSDMGDAVRQAKVDAKSELAGYYQEFVSRQTKNMINSGAGFSDNRKTVVDFFVPEIDISDARTVETKVIPEKSGFRAYALMMVPKESVTNFKSKQEEGFVDSVLNREHHLLLERVKEHKDNKSSRALEALKVAGELSGEPKTN